VKNSPTTARSLTLGGIEWFAAHHRHELGPADASRDLVNVADEIQVKVLNFDKDKQRVSLASSS